MLSKWSLRLGAMALLGGTTAIGAEPPRPSQPAPAPIVLYMPPQEAPTPKANQPTVVAPVPVEAAAPAAEEAAPKYGPTAPEDVKILQGLIDPEGCRGLKAYGWLDVGYTYASGGSGILAVETRENRFGNELLLSQAAIVLEKVLDPNCLSWGFNMTYYAGADASLLQPKGGIDSPPDNPRFSDDFRQLYVSAHLPVLTEGGIDIKLGRQGHIIGYESAMAPYRPFYSNDYQWFYSQDGAWTGALAIAHISKQLDVLAAITMGANTFFTMRGDSPCYIGQVNYWLTEEKNTQLTGSLHLGENAIFAAPGLAGDFDTVVELRMQHKFSPRATVVLQSNMGWDQNVPGVGTAAWYGVYAIGIYSLTCKLDINTRLDWFDDVDGTRIGVSGNFEEVTLGLDYHPVPAISLRPEIRGDFADKRAFNHNEKSQLTIAMDLLLKF